MVLAAGPHVAIVFGGQSAGGRLNDVWPRELVLGRVLDADPRAPPVAPRATAFALPPSPNPARGDVAMAVDVAREQRVDLGVFDVHGRRVATLHTGVLAAGRHAFRWGGGHTVSPGVYLVRMSAADREQVVRVVRLRWRARGGGDGGGPGETPARSRMARASR